MTKLALAPLAPPAQLQTSIPIRSCPANAQWKFYNFLWIMSHEKHVLKVTYILTSIPKNGEIKCPKVFPKSSSIPGCPLMSPNVSKNVSKFPQMSPHVSKCPQVSPSVPRYPQMSPHVSKCPQISPDVLRCPLVSRDIYRCPRMSPDVLRCPQICLQIFPDVLRCSKMSSDVPKYVSRYSQMS